MRTVLGENIETKNLSRESRHLKEIFLAFKYFRLSGNVTAQKLAHVDEAGEGEAEVDMFDHQQSF